MQKKTVNTMQLELYFAKQKTKSCFFIQINDSPHHVKFTSVILKLINFYIWISGLYCLTTFHTGKSKTWEKATETTFHKFSANWCSVKLNKIHKCTSAWVLFKYSCRSPGGKFIIKETPAQVFSFITFHRLKFSGTQKFLMTF